MTEKRPWLPAMMLREIAEGAPRLDPETFAHMRGIFGGFARILSRRPAAGLFRAIHPLLAYMSVLGPLLFNAARERVAASPCNTKISRCSSISHDDLIAHMQEAARTDARHHETCTSP